MTSSIRKNSHLTAQKYCQTVETSFGPCSSCAKFQQYLYNYGDSIINLCHIYNLPSSLAHHRCSTSTTPESLSSNNINHWFDSQSKDFDRLSKHLEYLDNILTKTQHDLDLSENQCKQQNETNQRLQQIIYDEKQSKVRLEELHKSKLTEIKNEYEQNQLNLNERIQSLTIQKMDLERQLNETTEECNSRGEQIEKLGTTVFIMMRTFGFESL